MITKVPTADTWHRATNRGIVIIGMSTSATLALALAAIGALSLRLYWLGRKLVQLRDDERKRIFDLSLDMMSVTGFDRSVKLVNPQFSTALGWSLEELTTTDFLKFVHPDDRASTISEMAKLAAGTPVINFRSRLLCKDGTYKSLAWKAVPDLERGLIYCVARDMTDDDQLVRSFVENIDQVVWISDLKSGSVLYVSPAYERIWGRPCAELYANPRGWLEAIHPEDRARVESAWAMQQATGSFTEEYRILRPDGALRWIRDRGVPVRDANGRVTRMIGLAEDITEHRTALEALQRNERLAAIGTLAAGIAHEINNPIGGIRLAAEAARSSKDSATLDRALADIMREADRCGRIIDNVLTFAREATSEKRLADLNLVVRDVADRGRRLAEQRGVRLEVACQTALPPVRLNATEIEQALTNLVANACEARAQRVVLSTAHRNGYVEVTVEDDGVGISRQDQRRIFEPFFTTRKGRGGSGLGLSITHGIVQDHAGTIDVESAEGMGTRMIIRLPAVNGAGQT